MDAIAFAREIIMVATPTVIAWTIVFGLAIGATYGYQLSPSGPNRWPASLWLLGIAFTLILVMLGAFTSSPVAWPRSLARGILWTFFCGALPIGRYARYWATLWLLRRRRRTLDG